MRVYPEYKASGIEWLPEVPENWDIWKMKFLTRIETGNKNTEDAEEHGEYPFYVRSDKVERISTYSFEGEAILTAGDGVGVAKVFHYANGKMAIHQRVYKISHFKKVLGEFLYYYIRENFEKEVIKLSAKTTVDSLRMPMLANFLVAYPSKQEQQAIVNFLDYKTKLIDNFIANRRQQQKLLKEQKAGIINKAVTKGINPHVNMKPSGIEWIGDIPEDWQVMELKFAAKMMRGKFSHRPRNDIRLYGGKYPFIQTGDVTKTEKYITTHSQTLNKWGYSVSKEFPKGTVVITIAANIGDIAILNFNGCFPDSVVGFYSNKNINEYLFYLLKSMKPIFLSESIEGAQLNLSVDRLSSIKVAIPTPTEQQNIVDYIKKEIVIIDTLITKYQKQIELMQEYRTALISQAVTGKIDVRHWQPKNTTH